MFNGFGIPLGVKKLIKFIISIFVKYFRSYIKTLLLVGLLAPKRQNIEKKNINLERVGRPEKKFSNRLIMSK